MKSLLSPTTDEHFSDAWLLVHRLQVGNCFRLPQCLPLALSAFTLTSSFQLPPKGNRLSGPSSSRILLCPLLKHTRYGVWSWSLPSALLTSLPGPTLFATLLSPSPLGECFCLTLNTPSVFFICSKMTGTGLIQARALLGFSFYQLPHSLTVLDELVQVWVFRVLHPSR